ncbi:MAG: MafI family immunity protein [bacterium]
MLNENLLKGMDLYAFRELANSLNFIYLNYFVELCIYGERKIAYENLCMQINEFDIKIHRNFFNYLKSFCLFYNLDESYWKNLEHLISWG